jgi:hypothetical protein
VEKGQAESGAAQPADDYPWRFRTFNLRGTKARWPELLNLLSGKRDGSSSRANHAAAHTILTQLKSLGAKSAVVEFPYHDRDFSEDYVAFYARLFRPGRRSCVRVHFFTLPSEDIGPLLARKADERKRLRRLRSIKDDQRVYLGFCVIRPIRDTPLGFTAIARPKIPAGDFQIWSRYSAHILGEEFEVSAFPFIEQDGRIGACAQAAVWMALRYIWAAEDGRWLSMHAISAAATAIMDETNALSVPSGSGGLDPRNMLSAVRSAGRNPHYFTAAKVFEDGHFLIEWKNQLDPIAITCRYLDSNIPVILLLGHTATRLVADATNKEKRVLELMEVQNGHAVTVVGYQCDLTATVKPAKGEDHLHVASWIKNLVVHNDQLGPYTLLPTHLGISTADDAQGSPSEEYRSSDIFGIIVPLPDKVFLRPDRAEEFAWMFVTELADEWFNTLLPDTSDQSTELPKLDKNQLVARTFLTRGYNHYQWLSDAQAHPELLEIAAALHYPRYVWISEFYPLRDGVPDFAHTVAHTVADATATSSGGKNNSAFLFGHLPGCVIAYLTSGYRAEARIVAQELENDHGYKCFHSVVHLGRRQQQR